MSIIHRFFVENIEENDIVLTSEMEHVFSTLTSLYDVLTMKSRQRDIHSWTTYEIHIYDVELHLIGLYIFNNSWVSPFNVSPNMLPILFGARGPQFPISQIIFQLSNPTICRAWVEADTLWGRRVCFCMFPRDKPCLRFLYILFCWHKVLVMNL